MLEGAVDVVIVPEAVPGEVEDVIDLESAAQEPDVILVDPEGAELGPAELTREVARRHPLSRILLVTEEDDEAELEDAVRAGARGVVVKPAASGELLDAVRLVAAGHVVIDERFADALLVTREPTRRRTAARDVVLTERRMEVLLLASAGRTDQAIAEQLGVGLDTVRRHVATICANLGAADRAAAVRLATRRRYLLGRGRGYYGIWDVTRPGEPIERFAETERTRAWMRCEALRAASRGRWARRLLRRRRS
ncbi:MAG: LuxR C-terminal-related transcriptional regulator [Candidatus Velamenicoccus archaeovorus]